LIVISYVELPEASFINRLHDPYWLLFLRLDAQDRHALPFRLDAVCWP
jgi:hypothetical protein